jgi:hypothetical protein
VFAYTILSPSDITVGRSVTANEWNLLSVPVVVHDFAKSAVWSQSTTNSFAYEGGYVAKDPVDYRVGYFVKFGSNPSAVNYAGAPKDSIHINVTAGYNMIGSLHQAFSACKIYSSPPGIIASPFYTYSNGYVPSTNINPGVGYWVEVNANGTLILDRNSAPCNSIPSVQDYPPSVSGAASAPVLSLPDDEETGVSLPPTLSWDNSSGASSYRLQVSTDPNFYSSAYDQSSIASTSQQVSGLHHYTTYYWHVNARNSEGASTWSDRRSFRTLAGIVLTWSQVWSNNGWRPNLSWIGEGQGTNPTYNVYRYTCTCSAGDCGGSGTLITSTNATSYIDNNVHVKQKGESCITVFWYYVTAINASNRVGVNSPDAYKAGIGKVERELPNETMLEGNYPNPFNPVTVIRYHLPAGQAGLSVNSYVTLKVYDVLGREVATLVNEQKEPGNYSVPFDASNIASGVYFYRLTSGSFVDVKRMLIMK